MATKKKVLFFMWSFSLGGGAEHILSTIAHHLPSSEFEISILEMEHFEQGYQPVPNGVRILPSYRKKSYGRILNALYWRIRIWFPQWVRKKLVKDEYDIEISFTIMNPPMPFSTRKNVKKIAWVHGSVEDMIHQPRYFQWHKEHFESANHIVAISKKTKYSIEQLFPEVASKIVTIYNGYVLEDFEKLAQENISLTIPPLSMCSIGRLEALKGTERTLQLMKALHEQGKKYHLYYIGTGEQDQFLREEVRAAQLEEYVHFLGYQKNPHPYLKQMKLLISMSKQEGFSGACVEALAQGVPFVSTNVGGAEELSQNGKFGKIISTDEEAIQAIITYMESEETLSKEETHEFLQQFTVEEQIHNIIQLFQQN